tara:strand:+ start:5019 stop:5339 length:321 start_codon:yes stop_codon:yes gene_type:complete
MEQKSIRKEVYYDHEIGWAELYKIPKYPDRVWIRAGYYLDLNKTKNFAKTMYAIAEIFDHVKEAGIDTLYCHADSQESFNFNLRLGFEPTFEIIPDQGLEFMKVEL